MARGTVDWFNAEKGYGFINPDEGGQQVFVHYSEIEGRGFRTLVENQVVEYELGDTPKGPAAHKVHPLIRMS